MKQCKDHLGNLFPSISVMCSYYNITINNFNSRRRYGWSLEKILTTPLKATMGKRAIPCKDYLGNTFKSVKKMCEYHHITYNVYYGRLKKGYGLKTALTK